MPAVPFHLHPARHELLARGPELAAAVMARAGRDGKDWDSRLDVDTCLGMFALLAEQESVGELRAVIVNDSHLFVFAVMPQWFSPAKPWMLEQFFMRVGRGALSNALDEIEDLGRSLGCSDILMATSLAANDEALGRLLARHGYRPQSSQHLKAL